MKKIFLIFLLTTSLFNSCNSQNNIDYLGQEGVTLFEKGDIKGALAKFDEIIKIDNKNEEAHIRKADCLDLLGDVEGSIKSYSNAIKIDPKNKIAIYNRANSYEKLEDFENAIADYQKAVYVDPNNISELNNKLIYHNLGILYGQQNQLDKAIETFSKAIDIDNKYADAYHNRGYAFQLKGKQDKAIEDFDKAINIEPGNLDYQASKNRSIEMKK